jgi:hypothetical protein
MSDAGGAAVDPGLVAFVGIFALAGTLLAWSVARGRAIARRLTEAGFVACDDEAPALLRALTELAGGHPPAVARVYEVGRCVKRPAGWGMLYRLAVADKTHADDGGGDRQSLGARFDVYLLDLRDPERVARGPVSVYLAPSAPGPLQRLLAGLVKSDPIGVPLELAGSPHAKAFLAAFSDRPGKLDERLPAQTQERLARVVDQGFFSAHFGAGKLALFVQHDRADLDRQLAYLAEWA